MIESILNRFRGTGDIFKISSVPITGNILYAVYIALVIGILYYTNIYGFINVNFTVFSIHIAFMLNEYITAVIVGLITGSLYMLGESMGWGKWIGSLAHPESTISLEDRYADDEGTRFPFIHKTANFFIKERENYIMYCQVALAIRGFYWWAPVYIFLAIIGLSSYYEALIISILLGIAFPLACYIGSKLDYNGNIWKINYSKGWENQELVYGLFQGIAFWYIILNNIF